MPQFAAANAPLPAACFPEGAAYANLGAIAPLMGNHLVDMSAPEMQARAVPGEVPVAEGAAACPPGGRRSAGGEARPAARRAGAAACAPPSTRP